MEDPHDEQPELPVEGVEDDAHLAEDGTDSLADPGDEDEKGLFNPPLYKQRYEAVFEILNQDKWTADMRKVSRRTDFCRVSLTHRNYSVSFQVVDFGCAESKFLAGLKRLRHCQQAIGVDLDEGLLEECKFKIEPIFADFLDPRKTCELKMYQMAGSVAEYDSRLSGVDAVTAIEL